MRVQSIRARLDHPIVDADGHLIEFVPLVRDFVAELAGESVAQRFDAVTRGSALTRGLDVRTRRSLGLARHGWWGLPSRNTLDRANAQLEAMLEELQAGGKQVLSGERAADLYTTYGMPLEITRDIAREHGMEVDEAGFKSSMKEHRLASRSCGRGWAGR